MPWVNDSGIGLPCILASVGLGVERLQVRRPAGHVEVDDPLGLGGEVERMDRCRVHRSRWPRRGRLAGLAAGSGRAARPAPACRARPSNGPGTPGGRCGRGHSSFGGRSMGRDPCKGQFRVMVSCRFRSTRVTEVQAASSAGSTSGGRRGIADAQQARGPRRGRRGYCRSCLARSGARTAASAGRGGRARARRKARSSRADGSVPASRDHPGRQHARRLDVGRVVEQDQRLERRVRPRALDHALLPRRGVEGQQARVEERPLPVGVEAAAILVVAVVGVILARGEVEEDPVARRLVGLDAGPADLAGEQPADGQGVVADQLGVEPEGVLPREPAVAGRSWRSVGRGRDDWR